MISRRNIRIKVMQTLYNVSVLENNLKPGEPDRILQKHFDQTCELFFFLTYFLMEVARYAETDARLRAAKHLPTYEDLHVNTKIAGNEVLWKLREDPWLTQQMDKWKPEQRSDRELVRKVYLQLLETPAYKTYINQAERNRRDEKEILEFILNDLMLASESFTSYVEETFPNWHDDGDLVVQLLVALLAKPETDPHTEMISPDKLEFARSLLKTVMEKNEHLQSLIIPKLKNWDPDRIAQLDMILMKMGVAEFLYFETIPPKVTINEYIDLAKEYSTPQSGQFVNGILDNIHKELLQQGKMHKVDFKKA